MADSEQEHDPGQPTGETHRRRPRYRGRNPRRFEEKYKELDPVAFPDMQQHILAQGKTPAGMHIPVMLREAIDVLRPGPGESVLDCTVGFGGHAAELIRCVGPTGRLVGCDVDAAELERTRARLAAVGLHGEFRRMHFAGIGKLLSELNIAGFDAILADLGVSSMQLDDPRRGFSYKQDGPLDMRMDSRLVTTAADLLMSLSESELSNALLELSDEPDHAAIARAIVRKRAVLPLTTTKQLVDIAFEAKGVSKRAWRDQRRDDADTSSKPAHPATLTFQALRILVNDELNGLSQLLRLAPHCLKPGGRIGIISFHSGEDRLVKKAFQQGVRDGLYDDAADEPIRPTIAEVRANPRSASAKLRWARRARGQTG